MSWMRQNTHIYLLIRLRSTHVSWWDVIKGAVVWSQEAGRLPTWWTPYLGFLINALSSSRPLPPKSPHPSDIISEERSIQFFKNINILFVCVSASSISPNVLSSRQTSVCLHLRTIRHRLPKPCLATQPAAHASSDAAHQGRPRERRWMHYDEPGTIAYCRWHKQAI